MGSLSGLVKIASSKGLGRMVLGTMMRATICPLHLGQCWFIPIVPELLLKEPLYQQSYPNLKDKLHSHLDNALQKQCSILLLPAIWTGLKESMLGLIYLVTFHQFQEKTPPNLLLSVFFYFLTLWTATILASPVMTACTACFFARHLFPNQNYRMSLCPTVSNWLEYNLQIEGYKLTRLG